MKTKSLLSLSFIIFPLFAFVSCQKEPTYPYVVQMDGYTYELSKENGIAKAKVIDIDDSLRIFNPAQTINGCPVNDLDFTIFSRQRNIIEAYIPNGIEVIPENTFSWTNVQQVYLPSTLKEISNNAFASAKELKTITIPDSVLSVGRLAFSGCVSLESAHLGSGINQIKEYTFSQCTSLRTINIPRSITTIETHCFQGCVLRDLFIPNTVVNFWNNTFSFGNPILCEVEHKPAGWYGTTGPFIFGFKEIRDVDGYKYIFSQVDNEKKLNLRSFDDSITVFNPYTNVDGYVLNDFEFLSFSAANKEKITDFIVPQGIKEVKTLDGFLSLTNISFPDGFNSVSYIINCPSIETITFPNGLKALPCLCCNDSLKNVSIPNSVTSIPELCFRYCPSLETIELPDDITVIANESFFYCTSLKNVRFPSKLNELCLNSFRGCASLESVILPSGVTILGACCFAECESLNYVYLPKTISYISESIFTGCGNLVELNYEGTVEEWNNIGLKISDFDFTKIKVIHCSDGDIVKEADK